jgi:hypothetical protein
LRHVRKKHEKVALEMTLSAFVAMLLGGLLSARQRRSGEAAANPSATPREFYEFALGHAKDEHDQLLDTWKQVDGKAQGTAAIAGLFLAAAFAFVRNTGLAISAEEKVLLAVTLTALVCSIGLSVWVLLIRDASSPLSASQVSKMVTDALTMPKEEASERYDGLLFDTLNVWAVVNDSLRLELSSKARFLSWAQRALLVSTIAALVLTLKALS